MRTKKCATTCCKVKFKEMGPKPAPTHQEKAEQLADAIFLATGSRYDQLWAIEAIRDYSEWTTGRKPPLVDVDALLLEGVSMKEIFKRVRKAYKRRVSRW